MDVARAIFHVGVVLALSNPSGPINEGQLNALRSEVARIWQPYGVAVTWFDAKGDCLSDDPWMVPVDQLLHLVAESRDSGGAALGAVRFHEGVPGDTIHLLYAPLSRMVLDSTVGMWSVRSLPPPLRDRMLGQALGRVLAHELGHVLLGLPSHDQSGLMRPSFEPADLVARGHDHLRLSRPEVLRLDARLHGRANP
jgi:hypothetical protein